MKALINKAVPIRIGYLRQASGSLFMAADTVLFCHTKKLKKAGQGHICLYLKERADLKMMKTCPDG